MRPHKAHPSPTPAACPWRGRSRHGSLLTRSSSSHYHPSAASQTDELAPAGHSSTRQQHPTTALLRWAVQQGGVVNPALLVTDDAPCRCRGVVAACNITLSSCMAAWGEQQQQPPLGPSSAPPLIAIPEQLCMTREDALQLLSQAMTTADAAGVITKTHASSTGTADAGTAALSMLQSTWQQAVSSAGRLLGFSSQSGLLQQRLQQLQPPMLLALLLAHQRRLGPASFWTTYISNLPDIPPCAWYGTVQQTLCARAADPAAAAGAAVADAAAAGSSSPDSSPALDPSTLQAASAAVAAKCAAAADLFGPALGGITPAEVAWAYGQVVSRAFALGGAPGAPAGSGIALLPVIDLLNHSAGAAVPVCWLGDDADQQQQQQQEGAGDREGVRVQGGFWCIWHQKLTDWDTLTVGPVPAAVSSSSSSSSGVDGFVGSASESGGVVLGGGEDGVAPDSSSEAVVLRAGQELYISYLSSCDAAAAALSFGFVPPELQQA